MSQITILSILQQLADTPKRNEKIAILESHKDNYLLKEAIRLAYDPNIRFWIKKIPSERTYVDNINCLSIDVVLFSELGRIYNRQVSGHEAIRLLVHLLSTSSEDDSKVIELIIKKDLNCGIAESTINKVWPKLIPEFNDIMKCHDSIEYIDYPAFAQVKCDGCLSKDWVVQTDDGLKSISDIVDSDYECGVISFNHDTGKEEVKKVLNKFKTKTDKRWFILTLANGEQTPPLTGNHLVWVANRQSYTRVDELSISDFVQLKR